MLQVNGGYLGDIPVLGCIAGANTPQLLRVSYVALNSERGTAYFPAFPPFIGPVLHDLQTVFPKIQFSEKAQKVIAEARAMEANYKAKKLPPYEFKTKPFAHQVETLLYAYHHPRAGLLLSPGLGKSKVAIDLINLVGQPTLLIVPATLISNWEEEFRVHSPKALKIVAMAGSTPEQKRSRIGIEDQYEVSKGKFCKIDEDRKPVLGENGKPKIFTKVYKTRVSRVGHKIDADVLIVSYDSAAIYYEQITKNFLYRMLVTDEAQRFKGFKSRRAKAVLALSQKAHRRVAMSGTAALGSPEDLYPFLTFLSPQILNQNFYAFRKTYLQFAPWNPKIPIGVKNLDRLNGKVRRHTIRYTQEEALDLPERLVIKRYIDMTSEQHQMVRDVMSDETLYLEGGAVSKEHKIAALGKLRQISSGFMYVSTKDLQICEGCHNLSNCVENSIKPYTKACSVVQKAPPNKTYRFTENPKLDACMELLEDVLADPKAKVLLWAVAVEEMAMLEKALSAAKIGYCRILTDPKNDITPLRTRDDIRVGLGSIAVGTGFTVNEVQNVIYFQKSFKLEDYLQSRDRCYRIGQKQRVMEYHLICRNSVDERIMQAIDDKTDIVEALLNHLDCMRCRNAHVCALSGTRPYEYDRGCILPKKKSFK